MEIIKRGKEKARFDLHFEGQGQLSTNMQIAAELLALPNRGGLLLSEVAERANISERQLYTWRQNPKFQSLVARKTRQNIKEVMPNILKAVAQKAEEGSAKHAELIMKYDGLLKDTHQHEFIPTMESPDVSHFDRMDEEIERELAMLRQSEEGEGDE